MKHLAVALGLASVASAHTLLTTLFVNGDNQGDGTCIRQRKDQSKATYPVYPLTGDAMACGYDGQDAVPYVCPAAGGSTLTFEFRMSPGGNKEGAIATGHLGPCAVYLKRVDDILNDSAAGHGWFKIWEDGYNKDKDKWCVDTLNENNGLLSVELPSGLPAGYYLARPEILALHAAKDGDPQFYTNCAQIFVENGPAGSLEIPDEYSVSIPGHVDADMPGLGFDIYEKPLPLYPIPGPKVYIPSAESTDVSKKQEQGVIPKNRLLKSANWSGMPIKEYSGEEECWAAGNDCWDQSKKCWASVQASGEDNCAAWNDYCTEINDECEAGNFEGPPKFTAEEVNGDLPGDIPESYGSFDTTDVTSEKSSPSAVEAASSSTSSAASATSTEASQEDSDDESEEDDDGEVEEDPGDSGLKVSEDGRCGGATGQTCEGSIFGNCCSKKGKCGRKTHHCGCGCQAGSGKCWD